MSDQNKYAAALDNFKSQWSLLEYGNDYDVICHALLMMQKLQEPSDGVLKAGKDGWFNAKFAPSLYRDTLKAMLEQAEKEIEG